MKLFKTILIASVILYSPVAFALTKPSPDTDPANLSFVFYLYYSNGQLTADRDFETKYDVLPEQYQPETVGASAAYRADIFNFKSEIVKSFIFDPKKGDSAFSNGKVVLKGPYVPDALKVQFYNVRGDQLMTLFVNAASMCNDDARCDTATGENENNCPSDCRKARVSATPVPPAPSSNFLGINIGDFDLTTILTYTVGGAGIIVLGWFGWKWWKKRREESFLPPPPPPPAPSGGPPVPPPPPPLS